MCELKTTTAFSVWDLMSLKHMNLGELLLCILCFINEVHLVLNQ